MSYEDLEKTRAERAVKEAKKEAKKGVKAIKSPLQVRENVVGSVRVRKTQVRQSQKLKLRG